MLLLKLSVLLHIFQVDPKQRKRILKIYGMPFFPFNRDVDTARFPVCNVQLVKIPIKKIRMHTTPHLPSSKNLSSQYERPSVGQRAYVLNESLTAILLYIYM